MAPRFTTPAAELPRDRWGRPMITPPDGGKPEAYTRVTTMAGLLEDTFNLGKWQQRMVLVGVSKRPDLLAGASAVTDPASDSGKKTLNSLAESALEAAGASARANLGTALHSFSERVDRGESLAGVPADLLPDLEAYARVSETFTTVAIEQFCVNDTLRVGGTYDRIVTLPAGKYVDPVTGGPLEGNVIADLKTGSSVDLGMGKIAIQLAVYANSHDYDHTTGTRSALPLVRTDYGVVFHVPAGEGVGRALLVSLADAWDIASTVAPRVQAWRKRRDLAREVVFVRASSADVPSLATQVREAASYADLTAIWQANRDDWTPGLSSLAAERRAELAAVA